MPKPVVIKSISLAEVLVDSRVMNVKIVIIQTYISIYTDLNMGVVRASGFHFKLPFSLWEFSAS